MKFNVHVVADAERDILDLFEYVARSGSPLNARRLIDKLEESILSLEDMPERGHFPPELRRINVFDYREIHVKIYRIIYRITGSDVFVHCVLDGRRDLHDLLERRLIRWR